VLDPTPLRDLKTGGRPGFELLQGHVEMCRRMAEIGFEDRKLIDVLGISRSALYQLRKDYPQFDIVIREGRAKYNLGSG
jgi:hypothetical protein